MHDIKLFKFAQVETLRQDLSGVNILKGSETNFRVEGQYLNQTINLLF